jgi:hypothetical protein
MMPKLSVSSYFEHYFITGMAALTADILFAVNEDEK